MLPYFSAPRGRQAIARGNAPRGDAEKASPVRAKAFIAHTLSGLEILLRPIEGRCPSLLPVALSGLVTAATQNGFFRLMRNLG